MKDVSFGVYDPTAVHKADPLDANGGLSIQCLPNTVLKISIGAGAKGDIATCLNRRMVGPQNSELPYELYLNAARTKPWGCQSSNILEYGPTSADKQVIEVYGRIPPASSLKGNGNNLKDGSYSDVVVVTISY